MASDGITLDTTIKELKKYPEFKRNTLFLLKEFGASNMKDILNINPYEFKNMHGVGEFTLNDLFAIQERYKHLSHVDHEETAKLLDKAAEICISKHFGQRDENGMAFFQHPMRVALRCNTDDEKIVALLHHIIEDTDVTPDFLFTEGFPQYIVDGILSVTIQNGESFEDYIARANGNKLGRVVKLHDLEDELDVSRFDIVTPDMATRLSKYLMAYKRLSKEDI